MPALTPIPALQMATADPLDVLSAVIGWTYFLAWTVSFYPQVILNYRRQFVGGLSIDFAILNVLGHSSYAFYNLSFYFDKDVQDEYRRRHDGSSNTVQPNDVAFSVHASILAAITVFQTFYYPRETGQRLSSFNRAVVSIFGVIVLYNLYAVGIARYEHLLDFLQVLAAFKLYISIAKYVPQAWENYQRKSTDGWSIENVLLDFAGGFLSFVQLFLDASRSSDWSSIIGNPAKFGLSVLSMLFTVTFIIQHYVLYTDHHDVHLLHKKEIRLIDGSEPATQPERSRSRGRSTERAPLLGP